VYIRWGLIKTRNHPGELQHFTPGKKGESHKGDRTLIVLEGGKKTTKRRGGGRDENCSLKEGEVFFLYSAEVLRESHAKGEGSGTGRKAGFTRTKRRMEKGKPGEKGRERKLSGKGHAINGTLTPGQ